MKEPKNKIFYSSLVPSSLDSLCLPTQLFPFIFNQLAPFLNDNEFELFSEEKNKVFFNVECRQIPGWVSTFRRIFLSQLYSLKMTNESSFFLLLATLKNFFSHHWKFCVKLTFFSYSKAAQKRDKFRYIFISQLSVFSHSIILYVFGLAQCLQRIFQHRKKYRKFSRFSANGEFNLDSLLIQFIKLSFLSFRPFPLPFSFC